MVKKANKTRASWRTQVLGMRGVFWVTQTIWSYFEVSKFRSTLFLIPLKKPEINSETTIIYFFYNALLIFFLIISSCIFVTIMVVVLFKFLL